MDWSVLIVATVNGDRIGMAQEDVGVEGRVLMPCLSEEQAQVAVHAMSAALGIQAYTEADA